MATTLVRPEACPIVTALSFPIYCQTGSTYFRINSDTQSTKVQAYPYHYCICNDETRDTKQLIEAVTEGSMQIIPSDVFYEKFDEIAEKLELFRR